MPRIARLITLLAAFALVPIVPAFAGAEPDPPTVTFGWSGTTVACGSRPDVRALTVAEGTQVIVVNATGATATVVVGDEDVLDVPVETGALLTLSPGEHVVTMVPACQLQSAVGELIVTVSTGAETVAPPAPDAPHSAGAQADELPMQAPAATSAIAPVADPTGLSNPAGSPSTQPAATSAPKPVGQTVTAVPVDLSRDEPARLPVAPVVASIFLFGVIVTFVRVVVRSRRTAAIERQSTQDQHTRQLGSDEALGSAADLRDRLRELVQAAHRGADPREIEAARRELFAQLPESDQHTEPGPPRTTSSPG